MRTPASGRGGSPASLMVKALLLVAPFGCQGDRTAGGSPGSGGGHVGHVAPAHKPKDFPGAVRRLRELNRAIDEAVSRGRAGDLVEDRTLPMALDIATWLPEIAADSDMPEKPWDVVNEQSEALVAAYRGLLDRATGVSPGDANLDARKADHSISALEGLLKGSDPRWFEGVAPRDITAR